MDSEIQTFITIWLTAVVSIIFCHQIAGRIPSGGARLISLLPVIYLFITLPFRLSSVHLGFSTISALGWVANFKLLLFAFHQGSLSATPPLPLLHFIVIALLPIQTKHTTSPYSLSKDKIHIEFLVLLYCGVVAVFFTLYKYGVFIHPYLILLMYLCLLYLVMEPSFAIAAALARAVLGLELERPFIEPYLATSLQDFWGRSWNLIITSILRSTIFHPVLSISARILGRKWAPPLAVLATFLVSGLMHEVIYYQVIRAIPTWEVTWFFVLHGFLLMVEVGLKRAALNGGWGLHRAVSVPLTLGIMVVTCGWLLSPVHIRHEMDLKVINELLIVVRFVGDRVPLAIPSLVK